MTTIVKDFASYKHLQTIQALDDDGIVIFTLSYKRDYEGFDYIYEDLENSLSLPTEKFKELALRIASKTPAVSFQDTFDVFN